MQQAEQQVEKIATARFELKYCERCGGLWMRPAGDARPYCDACAPLMAEPRTQRKRAPAGERRPS